MTTNVDTNKKVALNSEHCLGIASHSQNDNKAFATLPHMCSDLISGPTEHFS